MGHVSIKEKLNGLQKKSLFIPHTNDCIFIHYPMLQETKEISIYVH